MDKRSNFYPEFERTKQQHRALAILRLLLRQPGFMSNDNLISAYLDGVGLVGSKEELVSCLDRLEASGLVSRSDNEKLIVVELTAKGEEVAQGRCIADGVLRPSVDCPY